MKQHFVYILGNKRNGDFYIATTNNIKRRIYEHQNKLIEGFTKKHDLNKLLYFEKASDAKTALEKEKQLRDWSRRWKIDLIEKDNPEWEDLTKDLPV